MNKNQSIGRAIQRRTHLGLLVASGLFLGSLASCHQEPETVFNKSASERIDELTTEIQKTLTSSTTGWVLEYYPHGKQLYGGYPVSITFGGKGEALMAADAPLAGNKTDAVKSNYHLKSDKMVSLSFDTYNEAFHLFSDPDKSYGAGEGKSFEGDYEFSFVRTVSPDTLYLKGRKTGTVMRMFRPKTSAKEYLDQVVALKKQAYTAERMYQQHLYGLSGKLGGKDVVAYLNNDGYNILNVEDVESGKATEVPFIYTPEGLRFFRPYNGVTTLEWKEADKSYNTGAGDKLTARPDPDYKGFAEYLGTYELTFSGSDKSVTVTFEQAARNRYRIKGIIPNQPGFVLYADYNAKQHRFEINTQKLENTGGAFLAVWAFPNGTNLSWGSGFGMYSKLDETYTMGKRYKLVDNGVWGGFVAGSYILWKPNAGEYRAFGVSRFQQPVFTKK